MVKTTIDEKLTVWYMDEELDNLSDWFRANKLSLNVSKTNYVLFNKTYTSNSQQQNVRIDDTVVERVEHTKFLGIYYFLLRFIPTLLNHKLSYIIRLSYLRGHRLLSWYDTWNVHIITIVTLPVCICCSLYISK